MVTLVTNAIWALIGLVVGIAATAVTYERRAREAAEGRAAACRLCEVTGTRK